MYCTKCGSKVPDGANFCVDCGATVRGASGNYNNTGNCQNNYVANTTYNLSNEEKEILTKQLNENKNFNVDDNKWYIVAVLGIFIVAFASIVCISILTKNYVELSVQNNNVTYHENI